jgi:hypothetical protein
LFILSGTPQLSTIRRIVLFRLCSMNQAHTCTYIVRTYIFKTFVHVMWYASLPFIDCSRLYKQKLPKIDTPAWLKKCTSRYVQKGNRPFIHFRSNGCRLSS